MSAQNLFQSFLKLLFSITITFVFLSCDENRLDVDVSEVDVNTDFNRLDIELMSTPVDSLSGKHILLANKYNKLYEAFVEVMLREGNVYDSLTIVGLKRFISNKDIKLVFSEIANKFPKTQFHKEDFDNAFKHYMYYFPKDTIPLVVGYYSNFNAKALMFDSILAVGLDMYLGTENDIVKRIPVSNIPQYFKNKMEPEYLVADALKIFLLNKHYKYIGDDFLSTIVSLGKIMYMLEATMPETQKRNLITYSELEYNWCEDNEKEIWGYVIKEQLLFANDQDKINNFISEGPNTKGLPAEAPSRVGIYLGWQMVKDFMNDNPDISIQEMLVEEDSKKILKYYKP